VLSDPPRTGIVACMPPHVLTKAAMEEVPAVTDLALDLGLTEEETTSIPLGTPVVFDTEAVTMGEGLFSAKALDNRATVAAVLLALDRLPEELNVDLIVLFSTQEELGLRGVQTGVFATEPDLAICLDVTFGDQPDAKPEQTVKFGGGAAIALGPMLDRNLSQQLIRLAETKRIPHQLEVAISGTNADRIALSRAGVPTGLISVPLRYMHSATELVNLADLESVANLLAAFLEGSEAHA
ncbi:MAG: M20/M25/M40 family metallo-hydrolase, partial [Oscillospiraceae bacterium]|nr:M20/M25/M40 family metallo-hydrolase [Oscillospiraceae bacterium]